MLDIKTALEAVGVTGGILETKNFLLQRSADLEVIIGQSLLEGENLALKKVFAAFLKMPITDLQFVLDNNEALQKLLSAFFKDQKHNVGRANALVVIAGANAEQLAGLVKLADISEDLEQVISGEDSKLITDSERNNIFAYMVKHAANDHDTRHLFSQHFGDLDRVLAEFSSEQVGTPNSFFTTFILGESSGAEKYRTLSAHH